MRDLTVGNIHKNFLLFSVPIVLSTLLSSAFGIIDTAIAGLFLGAKGIAATGATASFISIVASFPVGYIMGSSSNFARIFTSKNYRTLKRTFYANLILMFGVSLLICVAGIFLQKPIFDFLNVDPAIYDEARIYYIISCVHLIVHICSYLFGVFINALGETKFPLYTSILYSVLNLSGNLLSVTVLGWGVFGIAMSTLVSAAVSAVLTWIKINSYFKKLEVSHIRIRLSKPYFTAMIPYGMPSATQQIFSYVANFLLAPLINGMGYTVVAVMSLVSRISSLLTQAYYACSRTVGNYIAQCIGAEKYNRIKPAIGVGYIHSYVIFLPMLVLFWLIPDAIIGMFIQAEQEPEVVRIMLRYMKVFMPFMIFNQTTSEFHAVFRSVRSGGHLLTVSMINSFGCLILSYIFAPFFGVEGLFMGTIGGAVLECAYIAVVFFTGFWVPRDLRAQIGIREKKRKKNAQA